MTQLSLPPFSRRSLFSGLGLGAAGLGLVACGAPGAADDADAKTRSGFSQADVKIPEKYKDRTPVLFWAPWAGDGYKAVQWQLEQFNESQTDIVALAESQIGYAELNTKFTAALQAKAVPDIVAFPEMQWLQFYFSGALAPLDDYFDDEWNLDVYIDAYTPESKAAGQTYLVPWARSTPLFYFNRDRYKEAGLPEEGPTSWDDLAEFSKELGKIKVDGKSLAGLAFSSADGWFAQADIWAFGGANSKDFTVSINDDAGVEMLEWQRTFIHEDKFGYMAKAAGTDFTSGLAAGVRASTASLTGMTSEAKFDVGCAFMPGQVNTPTKVPTGGSGLMIVKSDSQDRQDAAAELFRFLAKPELSAQWHLDTGYVPIVKKAALDQLVNAQTADRTNWFQAAVTEIETGLTSVYGDNKDPQTVLDGVAKKLQAILDDNKEDLEKVIEA
jgi:sn-glycerol 3-phosphate transport system substrate-binding protein